MSKELCFFRGDSERTTNIIPGPPGWLWCDESVHTGTNHWSPRMWNSVSSAHDQFSSNFKTPSTSRLMVRPWTPLSHPLLWISTYRALGRRSHSISTTPNQTVVPLGGRHICHLATWARRIASLPPTLKYPINRGGGEQSQDCLPCMFWSPGTLID